MGIKTIKEPDIYLTESQRRRYADEYRKAYTHYVGTPPSFEEFVRRKLAASSSMGDDS